MTDRILLSPPDVGVHERDALMRSFDGGWIAPTGPDLVQFEDDLAAFTGAESAVALASGTAALHLSLLNVGVKPGDDVVVQSATFAASAFPVVHLGATPVFVDVDRSTWCMDPARLEACLAEAARIGKLPAAVVPVDLYGLCPDYVALQDVCARYEVPIVEDAAEALGSSCGSQMAGTFGELGVLSFNGNKIMTTSGGGAVVGPKEKTDRIRFLATQAREPVLHYEHNEIGFNYRMSNLLGALGVAQLSQLPKRIEKRQSIRERYVSALPDLAFLDSDVTTTNNSWLSVGLLPEQIAPADVCKVLDAANIESRPAWKPMHLQPVFADCQSDDGTNAEFMFNHGLCLPSGSTLSEPEQDRVIDAVTTALTDLA